MNNCEKLMTDSFLSKILFYVLVYIYLFYFFNDVCALSSNNIHIIA